MPKRRRHRHRGKPKDKLVEKIKAATAKEEEYERLKDEAQADRIRKSLVGRMKPPDKVIIDEIKRRPKDVGHGVEAKK